MSQGVQILDVTQITLPSHPQTPPPMKLSFFDCIWVGLPAVQKLMLYADVVNADLSFPTLVRFLKSSLSATLLDYPPLSGKLTYVPSAGLVEVDFSDTGVAFVEAESGLDLRRLATDENHDVVSFAKLVPDIDTGALPCPVFAVQVTRFGCGGVAIGYSVHHAIADGKAMLQFMQAWAKACRASMDGTEPPTERRKPPFDRAAIKFPRGEEIARAYLRSTTPNLPITRPPNLSAWEEQRRRLARRTFMLDAPSIRCLKGRGTSDRAPSTFSAIAAHVWTCVARAKQFDPEEEVLLLFLMDCRARLDPPVDDDYFGNCVRSIWKGVLAGELTESDSLAKACSAIGKAIEDTSKDPLDLGNCENWIEDIMSRPFDKVVNATSSPRFRLYETDFGWGRPDRVEFVSMNGDGEFALIAGREEGTVQVTVSLDPNKMEAFAQLFLD